MQQKQVLQSAFPFLILAILGVGLLVGLYLVQQRQDNRQHASESTSVREDKYVTKFEKKLAPEVPTIPLPISAAVETSIVKDVEGRKGYSADWEIPGKTVSELMQYYLIELPKDGWEITDHYDGDSGATEQFINAHKGDRRLHLFIESEDGKVEVSAEFPL